MDQPGQLDYQTSIEVGSQQIQIIKRLVEAVIDVIGDASPFTSSRLERCIRRDPGHEVLSQIPGKVSKFSITQRLNGSHYCRGIDMVSFCQLSRRQEARLFTVINDRTDELLRYVHFAPEELAQAYRRKLEASTLPPSQRDAIQKELEAGLSGYTYLS